MLAAPHSGAGKTLLTLVILRLLQQQGVSIAPFKVGPDYIDSALHRLACGHVSMNLDPWAMRPELIQNLTAAAASGGRTLIIEAMMGLFDGALDGSGSAADLAQRLKIPVVLIVDCRKISHSIAALVSGFAHFRADLAIEGLILNKIGSARHEQMLRQALDALNIPILGAVHRHKALVLPERHLGLTLPENLPEFEDFLERASQQVQPQLDWVTLKRIAEKGKGFESSSLAAAAYFPPLGKHIAIARDDAFCFIYPHILAQWQQMGCEISFFSPLADEPPPSKADSIYLPGGYPELYAARLASNSRFKAGMMKAAHAQKFIYGECGGFMMLGESLEDKDGKLHAMLGLLPLATSIKGGRLHLGYRQLQNISHFPLPQQLRGHEFHYSRVVRQGKASPLFQMRDALGQDLGSGGLVRERIAGSFL